MDIFMCYDHFFQKDCLSMVYIQAERVCVCVVVWLMIYNENT